MEQSLDIFFRAFAEYKKATSLDVESVRFKKSNSGSGGKQKEDIVVYFSTCTIKEDWIEAIEKGIPFIQKAIAEERQFIRNDGEVLPIEKIRKTSVSSIQDLAKHSNYITHEAEEDAMASVMPDKMLMVQKESDYAVYENRVVYSTLVYLRDFVSKRLNAIKELSNKFESKSYYNRKIDFGSRKLDFQFSLHEERLNDTNFINRNSAKKLIDRLDDILGNIVVLLKTPLMMIVGKADVVKRPITKTNVLKMNRNFRESLACFDYIAEYQGDGYTIQRMEKSCSPFKPQILGDMSEMVMLSSFITYMYSLGMENELEKAYQDYLKAEKERQENEKINRLKSIKSTASMEGKSLEEYVLALEEAFRVMEKRLANVDATINEIKLAQKKEIEEIKLECETKIKHAEFEHKQQIEAINQEHAAAIDTLKNEHEQEITNLNAEFEQKMNETVSLFEERINNVSNELNERYNSLKTSTDSQITTLISESNKLKEENVSLSETKSIYTAEIIGLKRQLKRDSVNPTEFVTKSDFDGLEKDRDSFLAFFNDAWKEAKKYIRKKHLTIEKDEKKKEADKDGKQ